MRFALDIGLAAQQNRVTLRSEEIIEGRWDVSATEVEVVPVPEGEKELLQNLMQAYRHDMSEFTGEDPNESGSFGVGSYFDLYWVEPTRYPFKAMIGDVLVGFALVREIEAETRSIAEFFVLRRHRGVGVGRALAFALFDLFPGAWHVAQDENNVPAQGFWRRVVGEYTSGDFSEEWSDSQPRGPQQRFVTRKL